MLASRLRTCGDWGSCKSKPGLGLIPVARCPRPGSRRRGSLGTKSSVPISPDICRFASYRAAIARFWPGNTLPSEEGAPRSRPWRVFWWGKISPCQVLAQALRPGRGWSSVPQATRPRSSPPRASPLPLPALLGSCFPLRRRKALGILSKPHAPRDGASRPLIEMPGLQEIGANELRADRPIPAVGIRPLAHRPRRGWTEHDLEAGASRAASGAGYVKAGSAGRFGQGAVGPWPSRTKTLEWALW